MNKVRKYFAHNPFGAAHAMTDVHRSHFDSGDVQRTNTEYLVRAQLVVYDDAVGNTIRGLVGCAANHNLSRHAVTADGDFADANVVHIRSDGIWKHFATRVKSNNEGNYERHELWRRRIIRYKTYFKSIFVVPFVRTFTAESVSRTWKRSLWIWYPPVIAIAVVTAMIVLGSLLVVVQELTTPVVKHDAAQPHRGMSDGPDHVRSKFTEAVSIEPPTGQTPMAEVYRRLVLVPSPPAHRSVSVSTPLAEDAVNSGAIHQKGLVMLILSDINDAKNKSVFAPRSSVTQKQPSMAEVSADAAPEMAATGALTKKPQGSVKASRQSAARKMNSTAKAILSPQADSQIVRETAMTAPDAVTVPVAGSPRMEIDGLEIDVLLGNFLMAYEEGDIETFLELFQDGMDSGEPILSRRFKDDYQKLFSITEYRRMSIANLNWRHTGSTAQGTGDFELKITEKGSSFTVSYVGSIALDVVRDGDSLKIRGLDYYYR